MNIFKEKNIHEIIFKQYIAEISCSSTISKVNSTDNENIKKNINISMIKSHINQNLESDLKIGKFKLTH